MNGLRWLLLRSAHAGESERTGPPPPADLAANDDMWTQLFAAVVAGDPADRGLIGRVGEPYEIAYDGQLTERRVPELIALADWRPDVIISRGGYRQYRRVELARGLNTATKCYLGAGERWNPGAWGWMSNQHYDVIFTDSPAQRAQIEHDRPDSRVAILHKPAAACFRPVACEKRFDVVFNCSRVASFKGHHWLAKRLPKRTRVLRIGPRDPWFAEREAAGRLEVTWTGVIPRRDVPAWACQAAVGVVCDNGLLDTGPRVLPEMLAMDIPVLVRRTVRADLAAYVRPETGELAGEDDFRAALTRLRSRLDTCTPRRIYEAEFSLAAAARFIRGTVEEVRNG